MAARKFKDGEKVMLKAQSYHLYKDQVYLIDRYGKDPGDSYYVSNGYFLKPSFEGQLYPSWKFQASQLISAADPMPKFQSAEEALAWLCEETV